MSSTQSATLDFTKIKRAVAAQFDRMQKHGLFVVDADGDSLWTTYLSSFPAGTNPEYRKRTEHDCACCRSFVKRAGKIVSIIDGKLETIWDFKGPVDDGYRVVADAMSVLVRSAPILNTFLTPERTIGVMQTFEVILGEDADDKATEESKKSKKSKTWEHFFVNVPAACVLKGEDIGPKHSGIRADYDVLLRSLTELKPEAVETCLELIAQNSLYRGEEQRFALESFQKLQREFIEAPVHGKDLFVWSRVLGTSGSVARIRNTAIGTLLVDLSNGRDVEDAVKAFETVVAPANYKRPTALVTKAQVEKAKQAIADLGLTSALERRYATLADVTVNNLLFVDRNANKALNGDVFDEITTKQNDKSFKKVEEVPVEKFLSDILPRATSVEVLVENRHAGNLVSLVAPVDPTANNLFKWPNNFSWSYNGDMADAIKERVKKAGGNVTGELCCRLAWNYTDDLDFHMYEPGYHISFPVRRRKSPSGGMLDIDANGADGQRDDPAENIYYERQSTMQEGLYKLSVHNYLRRSTGVGFEVEIDILGVVTKISYDKVVRTGENIEVATLMYSRNEGVKIVSSLPSTQVSKKLWGVNTQDFSRVTSIMLSPNHWDGGGVGNRHYFFMIDGCANDGTARGFYNEFLKSELDAHRKVIEIVGSKMRTEQAKHQLSGLGFSSTQRNELTVRVKGAFTRVIKVVF